MNRLVHSLPPPMCMVKEMYFFSLIFQTKCVNGPTKFAHEKYQMRPVAVTLAVGGLGGRYKVEHTHGLGHPAPTSGHLKLVISIPTNFGHDMPF